MDTTKFGELNGFYTITESVSHSEMEFIGKTKSLFYGLVGYAYTEVGNGQFISIPITFPTAWSFNWTFMSIPIDDNRTLVDILPPKADRDEAKRKFRTLIESISIKKI